MFGGGGNFFTNVADIGAAAIPGVGTYLGAKDTNATNRELARDANQANIQSAREQMEFQERMSNTAHQREVEDLKKAGLNPILAANKGASSPPGAAGQSTAAQMKNPAEGVSEGIQSALITALSAIKTNADTKVSQAQARNLEADTAKKRVDTDVARKGIPASELKNDAFDIIRPYIKKLKEAIQSSGKPVPDPGKQKRRDYMDKQMNIYLKGGLR